MDVPFDGRPAVDAHSSDGGSTDIPLDAAPAHDGSAHADAVLTPDMYIYERPGLSCDPPQRLERLDSDAFVKSQVLDGLVRIAADIDADGTIELVVASGLDPDLAGDPPFAAAFSHRQIIYHWTDQGLQAGREVVGLAVLGAGDLDGDGRPELVGRGTRWSAPRAADDTVLVVRRDRVEDPRAFDEVVAQVVPGDRAWERPFDRVHRVAVADTDGDEIPDIVAEYPLQIYEMTEAGLVQTFIDSPPEGGAPTAFVTGDFDGDGAIEIVGANYGPDFEHALGTGFRTALRIFESVGDNTYRLIQQRVLGVGDHDFGATGDFDGDGRLDFLAGGRSFDCLEYNVYRAPANDTYERVWSLEVLYETAELGSDLHSVDFGDTDGDGDDEVVVFTDHAASVFEWDGASMVRIFDAPVCEGCRSPMAHLVDFDGDGRASLVVSAWDTVPRDFALPIPEGISIYDRVIFE